MTLRWRLALLFAVLVLLPALAASWVTHGLLVRSVEIGLREDLDLALEAGVRQARNGLVVQREKLRDEAEAWRRAWDAAEGDFARLDTAFADPSVRVEIAGGLVLAEGDSVLRHPPAEIERGAPPLRIRAGIDLGESRLQLTAPVEAQWRDDALRTSETLQIVRSLRARRDEVQRGFLWPFALIYGFALAVALVAAALVSRGFTRRVDRLVEATDRVAAGDWSVQVGLSGHDEIARLGQGFDRMVNTLDAQSRHLVEMETMAGWREMARALAHEIKNPLTPIQLTVEEMRERYAGDDPEYQAFLDECARIVIEEVESLRGVVGRFRDFSRPVELEIEPFDAGGLLRDIGSMQRDLQVEVEIEDALPAAAGDADRLRQVLMNLASNAREAGATRLLLGATATDNAVLLVFEDDGPGIPEAGRERIFEPYRTGKKTGLGLGLALVKGIVLAHGGSIEVGEGTPGGARFTVTLPRAEPASTENDR